MKLPRSLKIGAHAVPVRPFNDEQQGPVEGSIKLGRFTSSKEYSIEIWDQMEKGLKGEIFVHEILEGIDSIYGLDIDHRVLSTLSASLYQVLKENKLKF